MNPEKNDDFEIVNESELVFASRGRKSKISDTEIASVREQIKKNPNGWVLFNKKAIPNGMTNPKEIRNHKAANSANIRGLAKKLGMKCEIRWHKDTIPAVRFTKVKA